MFYRYFMLKYHFLIYFDIFIKLNYWYISLNPYFSSLIYMDLVSITCFKLRFLIWDVGLSIITIYHIYRYCFTDQQHWFVLQKEKYKLHSLVLINLSILLLTWIPRHHILSLNLSLSQLILPQHFQWVVSYL